jgi:carbamoyltransferase
MTVILGISAYYHDSAAAVLVDGAIVAAAQEERFTRIKHDARYPAHAIDYVLREAGVRLHDVDHVVFYEKPFLKFERLVETYLAYCPRGFGSFRKSMPVWIKDKLFQKKNLLKSLRQTDPDFPKQKLLFSQHHLSHAASAYYPSPFDEALVLTLDGVGEWHTTTVAIGRGADLAFVKEINFPHSLGLLYSAFTYYTGFRVNSGEYKLMGLAPYGQPKYKDIILTHLIDVKEDGSYRLNQDYFNYATGLTMTNARFAALFGQPVRRPDEDPLTDFHMDIAASIQAVTEDIILRMATALAAEYGIDNICLAGGVALNCVANGKLLKHQVFKNIWIQPAAGDSGGALGAALAAWHLELKQPRPPRSHGQDVMQGSYLGPSYDQATIETALAACGAVFERCTEAEMLERTAQGLADGCVIGWFQGRMEFGPRALGGRSILGDPRNPQMQKTLNLKIKFRESFRPFAPSILAEDAAAYFDLQGDSPYMLIVAEILEKHRLAMTDAQQQLFGIEKLNVPRSVLPAITHVDYSARIQTVHAATHPLYHKLISAFKAKTGCPVVVNTSFNVRGEPIVHTPEDAFRCFMGTDMDMLVIGNAVLHKAAQDPALQQDYTTKYALD